MLGLKLNHVSKRGQKSVSQTTDEVNAWMNNGTYLYFVLCKAWGPFYQHGLTLIPTWISNYIHYKLWDEITYPFLNFNDATVEV